MQIYANSACRMLTHDFLLETARNLVMVLAILPASKFILGTKVTPLDITREHYFNGTVEKMIQFGNQGKLLVVENSKLILLAEDLTETDEYEIDATWTVLGFCQPDNSCLTSNDGGYTVRRIWNFSRSLGENALRNHSNPSSNRYLSALTVETKPNFLELVHSTDISYPLTEETYVKDYFSQLQQGFWSRENQSGFSLVLASKHQELLYVVYVRKNANSSRTFLTSYRLNRAGDLDHLNDSLLQCTRQVGASQRVFDVATSAVIVFHEFSEQMVGGLPGLFLYATFTAHTGGSLASNPRTVLCRFPLTQMSVGFPNGTLVEYLPLSYVRSMTQINLGRLPYLVLQDKQLIRVVNIVWREQSSDTSLSDITLSFNETSGHLFRIRQMFATNDSSLLVLSDRPDGSEIIKFNLDRCSLRTNCGTCLSHLDVYCGWCVLENRCSTRSSCRSAADDDVEAHRALWLKDFVKNSSDCPIIYAAGFQRYFSIYDDDPSDSKYQASFIATNLPPTGEYLKHMRCRYSYTDKIDDHFDHTNVTFFKHGTSKELRMECAEPAGLVTNATKYTRRANNPVKGHAEVSLVYVSPGPDTLTSHRSTYVQATTKLLFVACETVKRCDECTQDYPVCSWKNNGTESCTAKRRDFAHLSSVCPPPPADLVVVRDKFEVVRDEPKIVLIYPKTNGFRNNVDIKLYFEHRDLIRDLSKLVVRVGEKFCSLSGDRSERIVVCSLKNVTNSGSTTVKAFFEGKEIRCNECSFSFSYAVTERIIVTLVEPGYDYISAGLIVLAILVICPLSYSIIHFCTKTRDEKKLRRASKHRMTELLCPLNHHRMLTRSSSTNLLETCEESATTSML
ncbi:hypothetical protein RvY_18648 [Ramazzottius varieornatus]|uniref:PSI domain-containing protein n=1 Tax=Ramazzottius varieornatus TaxID=947166 RepID=A0A1D1W9P4_RAMVA|nr:hypothetical protein RvY_18648 [Ramazzottius varieornatus]